MKKITRREFVKDSIGIATLMGLSLRNPMAIFAQEKEETEKEKIPDLAVATNGSPAELTRTAINLLGGMKRFVSRGDIVVVKPNIGWDRNPEQAANTNPEVVVEIVRLCLESGAKKVKVFDRPCNTPSRCYENSGIRKAASKAGAEVSYVVDAGFVNTKFPNGLKLKSWYLYKPALECDLLINVPIAKHHNLPRLTLGMKNLMGIMGGDRGQIHWNIDENLADLSNFIRPKLTVLDAVRILIKNGPQGGNLKDVKKIDTVIAGEKIATVDAYGATLFGLKPPDLSSVVIGNKLGLGEIDLDKIYIKRVSLS